MALTTINSSGIKDDSLVNADIKSDAAIAKSKLASLDLVNADINASAAIAGSKISPDFGSQNIVTTGQIQATAQTPAHFKRAVSGTSPVGVHIGNNDRTWALEAHSTKFSINDYTAVNVERLVIDDEGDVGIGVSPASGVKLHIKDATSDGAIILEGTSSTLGSWIQLQNNNNTANSYNSIYGADAGGQGSSEIRFINVSDPNNEGKISLRTRPSGGSLTDRLLIDSSGNVAIGGLTNPSSLLHLRTSTNHNLEFEEASGDLRISALNDARDANEVLQFAASKFNFITGNVGINEVSPIGKLEVKDTTGSIDATKTLTANFYRNDGTRNPRLQILHNQDGSIIRHTYSTGAGSLIFELGSTEVARFNGSGDLQLAAGKGIDFSSQTTSSATGATTVDEKLDHYECGTWTPTASEDTMTTYAAHYVRIGSLVYIQCYADFGSSSSSSGQYLGGLPFVQSSGNDYGTVPVNSNADLGSNLVGQIDRGSGSPSIAFAKPNNHKATGAELSGKFIVFSGTYQTNL